MGKDKQEHSSEQKKLSNKEYEAEIEKLHAELVKLQYWVQAKGLRIIVIFEGRDAAGKGGVIKRITERVSPRVFRVVALTRSFRTRKNPDVLPTLHPTLPGSRRSRNLRSQLV